MKRFLISLLVLALIMPGVIAPTDIGTGEASGAQIGQGTDSETGNGQGTDDPIVTEDDTGDSDDLIIAPKQVQIKAKDTNELKQMIQTRQQEMEQESLEGNQIEAVKNQNQVRLAVHSFLAMEDLIGGIGPQVSEIAREFDNSIQKTIHAENRMQTRNIFMFFFFGGDEVAAAEIEEELNINQNRIQRLNQLREQCNCTEELKSMFQEQIQNVEQEQTRLRELAQEHKLNKGLFGWLWK